VGGHRFRVISAGAAVTCGIAESAQLYCWGFSGYGLGTGTASPGYVLEPVLVAGGHAWASVDVSGELICGTTLSGQLYCWGTFNLGRLGSGSKEGKALVPTPVQASDRFIKVAAGEFTTCAITIGLELKCWGGAYWGTYGTGSWPETSYVPVPGAPGRWRSISSAGMTLCGVQADWATFCWGHNGGGRIGNGTLPIKGVTAIPTSKVIRDIRSNGWDFTCRVFQDDTGDCIGQNREGFLGTLTGVPLGPAQYHSLNNIGTGKWRTVQPSLFCTNAVDEAGRFWTWGCNGSPRLVSSANDAPLADLGHNYYRYCILTTAGLATCDGRILPGFIWKSVSVGGSHQCGIDREDRGWCWGENTWGQIGDGTRTNRIEPTPIGGGHRWRILKGASYYAQGNSTCGITVEGALYCWGDGLLGNGASIQSSTPIRVGGPTDSWIDVSSSGLVRCGTTSRSEVWCWGANVWRLADPNGLLTDVLTPTRVPGVTADRVVVIEHSSYSGTGLVCAWSTTTPSLSCWGDNTHGIIDRSATGFTGAYHSPQRITLP
jgi:hypothetical protein